MKILIPSLASYLLFGCFIFLHFPKKDPAGHLLQYSIIVAPFIPIVVYVLLLIAGFDEMERLLRTSWNRYVSLLLTVLLFVVPFDKRLLLDDLLFCLALFILIWCCVSWSSFVFFVKKSK
jgi:hypothetical protein